jgi:SHS2 domain-containing protein
MNMTMNKQHMYQTSDLACAAAISLFTPIEDVDKSDPRRAYFIFARTPELEDLLDKFQKRQLSVEPRAYFDQIKALKTRLYEVN